MAGQYQLKTLHMHVSFVSALPSGVVTVPLQSAGAGNVLFLASRPVSSWSTVEQGRGNLGAASRSTSDAEVGVYKCCFTRYFYP